MAKFILNIRPDAAAAADTRALIRRGVAAQCFPVMSLRPISDRQAAQAKTMPPHPTLANPELIAGLIFTSRHAIAYFAKIVEVAPWASKPVYVVGATSARAAIEAGFNRVITGLGGGVSLVPMITAEHAQNDTKLLWPSAVHKSFDMAAALGELGYDVIDWPVYETVFADQFPDDIAAAIGQGDVLAIVTLSARTSEALMALMKAGDLWHLRSKIIIIAGSQAIGDAAGEGWCEVIIARAPKRTRILAIATLVYRRYLRNDAGAVTR